MKRLEEQFRCEILRAYRYACKGGDAKKRLSKTQASPVDLNLQMLSTVRCSKVVSTEHSNYRPRSAVVYTVAAEGILCLFAARTG